MTQHQTLEEQTANMVAAWDRLAEAAINVLDMSVAHPYHGTLEQHSRYNSSIRLNLGRANGQSTWIVRTAAPDDLIVVHTLDAAKTVRRTLNPVARVISIGELISGVTRGTRVIYPRIYVDDFYMFCESEIVALYRATAYEVQQRWFLLG